MSKSRIISGIFVFLASLYGASPAQAWCMCQCVGGQMQPLCSGPTELAPLCPPTVCPLVPPSLPPIAPIQLPPLGTSRCREEQVYDRYLHQYVWETVCGR